MARTPRRNVDSLAAAPRSAVRHGAQTRLLLAAALAAVLAVGAGCTTLAVGDEGTTPLALRALNDQTTSGAAAFAGTVEMVGGCVALRYEGTLYTIVWLDQRTTWDPDLQQVTMRRSEGLEPLIATVGEFEQLGGMLVEGSWEDNRWIEWVVQPNPDCPRKVAVI